MSADCSRYTGRLYADPEVIRAWTLDPAPKNISTIMYAQTRGDLQRLYTLCPLAVDRPPRTTEGPALALCSTAPTPCQWFSHRADLLDSRSAPDFRSAYTTAAAAGKRTDLMAARLAHATLKPMRAGADRLLFGIDDTPTPRYGPKVEGAGVPHNPTPFASAVWRNNVFATQFHPEKSQSVGLEIPRRFAERK